MAFSKLQPQRPDPATYSSGAYKRTRMAVVSCTGRSHDRTLPSFQHFCQEGKLVSSKLSRIKMYLPGRMSPRAYGRRPKFLGFSFAGPNQACASLTLAISSSSSNPGCDTGGAKDQVCKLGVCYDIRHCSFLEVLDVKVHKGT